MLVDRKLNEENENGPSSRQANRRCNLEEKLVIIGTPNYWFLYNRTRNVGFF